MNIRFLLRADWVYPERARNLTTRMAFFYFRLVAVLAVVTMVPACRRSPLPALEGEWVGCHARVREAQGIVCEVEDGQPLHFRGSRSARVRARPGGDLAVTPDAVGLRVEPGRVDSLEAYEGGKVSRLALRLHVPPSFAKEAQRLRGQGDLDGAAAILEQHVAEAPGQLARVELARGHVDRARALFAQSIQQLRSVGRFSEAHDESMALAFALVERSQEYRAAHAVLEGADATDYPEGRARLEYYRALLSAELGDVRIALEQVRNAARSAKELGLGPLAENASSFEGLLLLRLGRFAEAARRLPAEASCASQVNAAYAKLVELDQNETGAQVAEAAPVLATLETLVQRECEQPYTHALALGNLAHARLLSGQPDRAWLALQNARARIAEPKLGEALEWLDLEARIQVARARPREALALWQRESAVAIRGGYAEAEWRAVTGIASLHTGNERLQAFRDAEAALERAAQDVPFAEGRGRYLATRAQSTRGLIQALRAAGRLGEAFTAARVARRRVLRGLAREAAARDLGADRRVRYDAAMEAYRSARRELEAEAATDWQRSDDELAHTKEDRRARARAVETARDAVQRELAVLPDELPAITTPTWLSLGPGVSFFATRDSVQSQLPAWPVGEVLRVLGDLPPSESVPLAYALDVARSPAVQGPALVVGDPRGDLPEARNEAREVAELLRARGLEVVHLEGDAATRDAVLDAIQHASLFHYAGHADRDESWSGLRLAQQARLTAGDIVGLSRVPALVVVLGCEAAGDSWSRLGIAEAFVLAGSEAAIAPTYEVPDAQAHAGASQLYAGSVSLPDVVAASRGLVDLRLRVVVP